MKVLALIAHKGGVSKTTLAIHLAAAAAEAGYETVLLDLDRQGSASGWYRNRGDKAPEVLGPLEAPETAKVLAEVKRLGAEVVVIDTPPHGGPEARQPMLAADFVLVPCKVSWFDIDAVAMTASLCRETHRPASVVWVQTIHNSRKYEAATEAVQAGIAVCPIRIGRREVFPDAIDAGLTVGEMEPGGKSASEIAALWAYAAEHLGIPARKHPA